MSDPFLRHATLITFIGLLLPACNLLPSSAEGEENCSIPVVRITGVEVKPLDREEQNGKTSYFYTDVLREQIVFAVETQYETVGEREVECPPDDPLYDPIPGVVLNPVEFGGWRTVEFDGPIRAHGEALPAHTNLLEVEALEDDYGIRASVYPFAIHHVRLDRDTYDVPDGAYEVSFAWVTSEGEALADRVAMRIDLR